MQNKKLVIFNQAANYLTVGLCNAFASNCGSVTLIAGSVHEQGESLASSVRVHYINRWHERPSWKKAASYLIALLRIWLLLWTRYRRHEVLFVSVPPMGYLLNLLVRNRFSMVIWDLYPDTFRITGMSESHPIYWMWARLNRLSFRKAFRLYAISDVMADAIGQYVPREKIIVHPIWAIFPENQRIAPASNLFIKAHNLQGKFIVQYSGNIGITHNVELLLDVADRLKENDQILFQIIGRGPRQPYIEAKARERMLANVHLLPFQTDEMFPHSLSAANLGVVILDSRVSRGSVPSKCYNLMSFGVPSLYVAAPDSELARYAERFGHAGCFSADQLDDIANFISALSTDVERQRQLSESAEAAAMHFRPSNALAFASSYIVGA